MIYPINLAEKTEIKKKLIWQSFKEKKERSSNLKSPWQKNIIQLTTQDISSVNTHSVM